MNISTPKLGGRQELLDLSPSSYDWYKYTVDRDITEVVRLEAMNDYLLAEVTLENLERFGQKYPEHNTRYAGELALAGSVN